MIHESEINISRWSTESCEKIKLMIDCESEDHGEIMKKEILHTQDKMIELEKIIKNSTYWHDKKVQNDNEVLRQLMLVLNIQKPNRLPSRFRIGEEGLAMYGPQNHPKCIDCGTLNIKLEQFEAICCNGHCWGYVDCDVWRKREDKK